MKKIIWTCDTEIGELGNVIENAYDIFVLGKVQGEEVGIHYINEIAHKYGATIHHFIDVYQPKYSRQIIDACERIIADGHSIGLHTHPSLMYGKRYMYEYSLSEQQKIIEYGQNFFEKHLGYLPNSHRAGGYGADENTIFALESAGIKIDSSYYHNNGYCHLPQMSVNSIQRCCGTNVLEMPVSVLGIRKTLFGIPIWKNVMWQKLDFRYGASVKDILTVIRRINDDAIIVLFLHSFNFLELKYNVTKKHFDDIKISNKMIEKFECMLEEIASMGDCEYGNINCIKKEIEGWCYFSRKEILEMKLKQYRKFIKRGSLYV